MSFYNRLVEETKSHREELYNVPVLRAGLAGDIDCNTYIAYLTQAYHHVKHTVPYLMAMGARLPENKKWLQKAVIEYLEEEVGHEEWILNDIEAAGGDKEAARHSHPSRATEMMVAYNYDYIARKNPIGFLGMVFMLESTSTEIATMGADAIKEGLGLPKSAFTYLFSHGALDIEHMKFFQSLMEKIDDKSDQDAIIHVAQTTFHLFAELFRAIPFEQKEERHAA
jgi:long-chain acyl-CoA synthetase